MLEDESSLPLQLAYSLSPDTDFANGSLRKLGYREVIFQVLMYQTLLCIFITKEIPTKRFTGCLKLLVS
jgi:hypothetical protein